MLARARDLGYAERDIAALYEVLAKVSGPPTVRGDQPAS
jgi:hypothetical protein